jgi:hypothetical protein
MAPYDYENVPDFGTHSAGNLVFGLNCRNYYDFDSHSSIDYHSWNSFAVAVRRGEAVLFGGIRCHNSAGPSDYYRDNHCCCGLYDYNYGQHTAASNQFALIVAAVAIVGWRSLHHCRHFRADAVFGAANIVAKTGAALVEVSQFLANVAPLRFLHFAAGMARHSCANHCFEFLDFD